MHVMLFCSASQWFDSRVVSFQLECRGQIQLITRQREFWEDNQIHSSRCGYANQPEMLGDILVQVTSFGC